MISRKLATLTAGDFKSSAVFVYPPRALVCLLAEKYLREIKVCHVKELVDYLNRMLGFQKSMKKLFYNSVSKHSRVFANVAYGYWTLYEVLEQQNLPADYYASNVPARMRELDKQHKIAIYRKRAKLYDVNLGRKEGVKYGSGQQVRRHKFNY